MAKVMEGGSGIAVLEQHAFRLGTMSDRNPKEGHQPARRANTQRMMSARGSARGQLSSRESQNSARGQELASSMMGDAGAALSYRDDESRLSHLRINEPQRIEPPRQLNAPPRIEDSAGGSPKKGHTGQGALKSKLKDFSVRAEACRRAGRLKEEAEAMYCQGVILDNSSEYSKAVTMYEKFLNGCRAVGDVRCEALALNCIGVNQFKMGRYEKAIDTHEQHLEKADVPGKFVAHSNLGLCYSAIGDSAAASLNHRHALRYAIVLSSMEGEALACGNLGAMNLDAGDMTTARACMERHLKLSSSLHDSRNQASALEGLGRLAQNHGSHSEARKCFEQARELARSTGAEGTEMAAKTKVEVGMARGDEVYSSFLENYSQQLLQDDDEEDQ